MPAARKEADFPLNRVRQRKGGDNGDEEQYITEILAPDEKQTAADLLDATRSKVGP